MSVVLSSVSAFVAAVATAQTVDFTAYTLGAGSARDALLEAARAGVHVRVRLERDPLDAAGGLGRVNAAAIAELAAAGADAALTRAGDPLLHMKAALVDGVAWLDDRNWSGIDRETVLRDSDSDDVASLTAAMHGETFRSDHFATSKAGAQWLEVDVIQTAGAAPLAVESESFGGGAIYNALLKRATAGWPTRLIVAGREAAVVGPSGDTERRRLSRLAALGVDVRTGTPGGSDLDEKLAVGPAAAWIGSANATYAGGSSGDQRDWGLATAQPALIDGLRAAFERNWDRARALPNDAYGVSDTP